MAGGKVTDAEVIIPYQKPRAWKLEQWNPGVPDKIISFDDAAWKWNGAWVDEMAGRDKKTIGKAANSVGAEVSLNFNEIGRAHV